jgi:uncharacterized protein YcsI (UPF0317 family)
LIVASDLAGGLASREARARVANGLHRGPTTGLAPGFAQANLVVLPAAVADHFASYCLLNPAPCPLLERLGPGEVEPARSAPGADLRYDLPRYRVYRPNGLIEECADIARWWRPDAVAFLLGCSFTFESALARAGIPLRHWEAGTNVPMYRTNRLTASVRPFEGPLVVSMRPIPAARVDEAIEITAGFPTAHGAPVHHGDPSSIGIDDLARPDWGDPPSIQAGDSPVFWACGVTSQVALMAALSGGAIPWAITHAPGHMLVTDLPA